MESCSEHVKSRITRPLPWSYGIVSEWPYEGMRVCDCADMIKHHVTISSVNTLSRLCGAMAKKIFPSVSQSGSMVVRKYGCMGYESIGLCVRRLMQYWEL